MKHRILTTLLLVLTLLGASCSSENELGNPLPTPADTTDPVIGAINGVTDGGTASGTVAISAAATDNVAVTSFTLTIDGDQATTTNTGNLSFSWDTTAETNAAHSLVFTARDARGNEDSQTVSVTVNNAGGADTTDPVIGAITGVTEGGNVSGTVAITAAATDNVGVTSYTLDIDGTEVASDTDGSLEYSWDTTTATNAAHSLVFTAADAAGNDASTTISVTVNNAGGGGAQVSGIVLAPNGDDPVSGALVYSRAPAAASALGDPPGEAHDAFDYSAADGSFELTGVPVGSRDIVIIKGAFSKVITIDVLEGGNTLSATETTLPASGSEVGKILVVTGAYDYIQNVLAKLGLGEVDGLGNLVLGTETFDLVDGNGSLPDGEYDNFDTFFATETNFNQYRTIFLNCGNNFETDFFADAEAMLALKTWVEGGGRLYCTDWSYDFCEQLFPTRIDFASFTAGDGFAAVPETADEAQMGANIESLVCDIEDTSMRDWLAGVGATTTAASSQVNVIDWLPGWSAIEAVDGNVKVWATGNVTFGFPETTVVKPVTVSFSEGDGVVLFSSYHTEASTSLELTPQDRVLQYLIFEIL